jgi:hypothetical protein
MRRPVNSPYSITTEFGVKDSYAKFGYHSGVDYAVPLNRPIYAPTSGQLENVVSPTGGNMVVIKANGLTHRLMHNNSFSRGNGWVNEGDEVAKAGTTGLSTGVHSHWDINKEGTYPTSFSSFINPAAWLEGASMATPTDVLRIIASEVEGFDMTKTHKGEYDKILTDAWGSKPTDDYVRHAWKVQKTHRGHLTAQIKAKDVQIATLTKRADVAEKSLAEANKEITSLKAQLAIQSDDTQLLNSMGEVFKKLIARWGVKG